MRAELLNPPTRPLLKLLVLALKLLVPKERPVLGLVKLLNVVLGLEKLLAVVLGLEKLLKVVFGLEKLLVVVLGLEKLRNVVFGPEKLLKVVFGLTVRPERIVFGVPVRNLLELNLVTLG
jgi:hypothetical protein